MRVACIPLILLGGYFGYRFASELYGQWSGVTFLVLWTFSPLILGWGATICPDVHAAALGIVGLYTFWRWLKTPTWGKAIIAGICLGLLPLTKTTWIIAFPIWLLLWGIWRFFGQAVGVTGVKKLAVFEKAGSPHPNPLPKGEGTRLPFRQFAVIMLLGLYMINMGYLFDGSFRPLKDYQFISGTLTGHEVTQGRAVNVGNRFADTWLGHVPVPLPAEFVQGIDTQRIDFERTIESYARGVWSDRGWWWYYGYVLLLKEPLGVLGLLLLALFVSVFYRKAHHPHPSPLPEGEGTDISWRDELTVLIPLLAIFIFISSQDGFSIHPRYVVFVLPLLYIFASKTASIHSFSPRAKDKLSPLSPSVEGKLNPLPPRIGDKLSPLSLWERVRVRACASTMTTQRFKNCLSGLSAVLLIWVVISSMSFYPHSMSYFNELAGKPKNYPQYLLGSNIDWGQEAYALQTWAERNPDAKPLYISYSTPLSLEKLGIESAGAVPTEPTAGWMVVGVNDLFTRGGRLDWLKEHEPVGMIGYSVWVFEIEERDVLP